MPRAAPTSCEPRRAASRPHRGRGQRRRGRPSLRPWKPSPTPAATTGPSGALQDEQPALVAAELDRRLEDRPGHVRGRAPREHELVHHHDLLHERARSDAPARGAGPCGSRPRRRRRRPCDPVQLLVREGLGRGAAEAEKADHVALDEEGDRRPRSAGAGRRAMGIGRAPRPTSPTLIGQRSSGGSVGRGRRKRRAHQARGLRRPRAATHAEAVVRDRAGRGRRSRRSTIRASCFRTSSTVSSRRAWRLMASSTSRRVSASTRRSRSASTVSSGSTRRRSRAISSRTASTDLRRGRLRSGGPAASRPRGSVGRCSSGCVCRRSVADDRPAWVAGSR